MQVAFLEPDTLSDGFAKAFVQFLGDGYVEPYGIVLFFGFGCQIPFVYTVWVCTYIAFVPKQLDLIRAYVDRYVHKV